MVNQKVNEDLQKEREMCTFNLEELTNFLDDGVKNTEKRRKLGMYILYTVTHYLRNFSYCINKL